MGLAGAGRLPTVALGAARHNGNEEMIWTFMLTPHPTPRPNCCMALEQSDKRLAVRHGRCELDLHGMCLEVAFLASLSALLSRALSPRRNLCQFNSSNASERDSFSEGTQGKDMQGYARIKAGKLKGVGMHPASLRPLLLVVGLGRGSGTGGPVLATQLPQLLALGVALPSNPGRHGFGMALAWLRHGLGMALGCGCGRLGCQMFSVGSFWPSSEFQSLDGARLLVTAADIAGWGSEALRL